MHHRSFMMTVIAATAVVTPAVAEVFYDQARVLEAQPIYEPRVVPEQVRECGYQPAATRGPVDPGTLGNARTVDPDADLVGALQRDVQLREPPSPVHRCRMVTRAGSENRLAGYRVRYEYGGRIYERRVAQHPGNTIAVSVQLSAGFSAPRRVR